MGRRGRVPADRVWVEPGRAWHGHAAAWSARSGAADEARVVRIVWDSAVLGAGTRTLLGMFTDVGVLVCSPGSAVWVRTGMPAVP